jgi:hypothetical protein
MARAALPALYPCSKYGLAFAGYTVFSMDPATSQVLPSSLFGLCLPVGDLFVAMLKNSIRRLAPVYRFTVRIIRLSEGLDTFAKTSLSTYHRRLRSTGDILPNASHLGLIRCSNCCLQNIRDRERQADRQTDRQKETQWGNGFRPGSSPLE